MTRLTLAAAAAAFSAMLCAAAAVTTARAERRQAALDWLAPPPARDAGSRRSRSWVPRIPLLPSSAAERDLIPKALAMVGWDLTPEEWQALRVVSAFACGLALSFMALLTLGRPLFAAGGAAGGLLLGQGLPEQVWKLFAHRRRQAIDADLLPFVDLLGVLTASGETFEHAAELACAELPGVLATEFSRMLAAQRAHALRLPAALRALALRLDHPEVRYLAAAIPDAAEIGRGMGDTLLAIARNLRAMRNEDVLRRAQSQGISANALLAFAATLPTVLLIVYPGLRLILAHF